MTFQDENIAPNTFLEIEIVNTYQNMCLTTRTEGRLAFFMSCCNSDAIRCNPVATWRPTYGKHGYNATSCRGG